MRGENAGNLCHQIADLRPIKLRRDMLQPERVNAEDDEEGGQ